MKIVVSDVEYDYEDAVMRPPIEAVKQLRKLQGVTPRSINLAIKNLTDLTVASLKEDDDTGPAAEAVREFEYSDEWVDALVGLAYLAKQKAGEPYSVDDARRQEWGSVHLRVDVSDSEDSGADPKAPSGAEVVPAE